MNSNDIIMPMATMAGLTLLVALRLGIANSWAVISKKVHIKCFRQFDKENLPENLISISQHYKNMYEMPVLFYTWIIILLYLENWDQLDVSLAWAFVVFRVLHSIARIPNKDVNMRFGLFLGSYGVLCWGWIRLLMNIL